jgi:hypothetical protein
MMDGIGFAIAGLLPHACRGAYGDDGSGDVRAHAIGRTLSA